MPPAAVLRFHGSREPCRPAGRDGYGLFLAPIRSQECKSCPAALLSNEIRGRLTPVKPMQGAFRE